MDAAVDATHNVASANSRRFESGRQLLNSARHCKNQDEIETNLRTGRIAWPRRDRCSVVSLHLSVPRTLFAIASPAISLSLGILGRAAILYCQRLRDFHDR